MNGTIRGGSQRLTTGRSPSGTFSRLIEGGLQQSDKAGALEHNRHLDRHRRVLNRESDREAVGLEALLGESDSTGFEVGQGESGDGCRCQENLSDVAHRRGWFGEPNQLPRVGAYKTDVGQPVVAFLLEAG